MRFVVKDYDRYLALRENITASGKLRMMEHVSWWLLGDRVAAFSEGTTGGWETGCLPSVRGLLVGGRQGVYLQSGDYWFNIGSLPRHNI